MGELVITRYFDAPREAVWKAWTDPEQIMRWWGPKDFTSPVCKIDFKVGGKYLLCMRGKAGPDAEEKDYWSTGTYKEILPMEKFIVMDSFADENGNIVSSTYYGMPEFPMETQITVTFEDIEGKTKMTLKYQDIGHPDDQINSNMEQGWNQSFDKLKEILG